jgi:hypothetical protein
MSERAQDVLADVLRGEVPGTCSDVDAVREAPSLQCAWDGALDYQLDPRLWWWFVDLFVDDPEERARCHRVAGAAREVFVDLARLHYAETGKGTALPEPLIRAIEMRVVRRMRPSAYRVAIGARGPLVKGVSATIMQRTEEPSWRTRS